MVWGERCRLFLKFRIPGETLIPGKGKGEAFHPGIGYASYLNYKNAAYQKKKKEERRKKKELLV